MLYKHSVANLALLPGKGEPLFFFVTFRWPKGHSIKHCLPAGRNRPHLPLSSPLQFSLKTDTLTGLISCPSHAESNLFQALLTEVLRFSLVITPVYTERNRLGNWSGLMVARHNLPINLLRFREEISLCRKPNNLQRTGDLRQKPQCRQQLLRSS